MGLSFLKTLVDVILPPRCPVTGTMIDVHGGLSAQAWKDLAFITAPYCACCGHPFGFSGPGSENADPAVALMCMSCLTEKPEFTLGRAALLYDDASRDMILGFKHADQTHYVVSMVPWLMQAGRDLWPRTDMVIPVPLHPLRLLRRRYNQSALMGRAVAMAAQKPFVPDILRRVRSTPVQGHLNARDRQKNVAAAFAVLPRFLDRIRGKNIMLVDDVFTTGATLNECARTLKKAGASEVYVLTLAKVPRNAG